MKQTEAQILIEISSFFVKEIALFPPSERNGHNIRERAFSSSKENFFFLFKSYGEPKR